MFAKTNEQRRLLEFLATAPGADDGDIATKTELRHTAGALHGMRETPRPNTPKDKPAVV